ncbi:hypothetical protein FE257_001159 [Aspergillus nanangensis]|uniref:Uncharacterized protein n=1 Tax=Aspergillus nanangensis TaxID=2582783 RepID=A0AAD4CW09_ASPNN|nr:hypothetical protein FE257_001159 [Aspergillus nanangensis]
MASNTTDNNYQIFRECLSTAIVEKSNPRQPTKLPKRRSQKPHRSVKADDPTPPPINSEISSLPRANPEDLAEFIDFIASEIFTSLPVDLQTLTYSILQHNPSLEDIYATPLPRPTLESLTATLPVSVAESLSVYGLIPDVTDMCDFLNPVFAEYVVGVTRPPPVWATTRTDACEICERDWIPLSYHHLIPRGVHAKVLKKGWHDEWMLNSVAWLCRACHSFVHRIASNEELAREWYTVERILERQDVQDWARWVARVRWKAT